MSANTYKVEYSSTGRAKCKDKNCKEVVDKGVLRIGKMTIDMHFHEGDMKTDWYHAACWFDAQKRTRPGTKIVTSTDDLEGYSDLKSGDKETIKDLIAGKKGAGGGGAKKKSKKAGSDDDEEAAPKKKKAAAKKKKGSDSDGEEEKPKKKRAAPKKKKADSDDDGGDGSDDEPAKKKKKTEKKSGGGGGGGKTVTYEVDSKFWEYSIDADNTVTYRWGKIGSGGQSKTEDHANAASAQKAVDKLVRQKEKKGYEKQ